MSSNDYKGHTCGECRNYVPDHSDIVPEWFVGKYNTGWCKPFKNGPAECKCQREAKACCNFRKRRKPPVGKKTCACRECQYNNPTPDGHWCALLNDYMAPVKCDMFQAKDYDHDKIMPQRYKAKWDEMNSK